MMQHPEITIIVPNYNTEKYLPRCLDSLTSQTFKNIEIIVVDDGSKDNSAAVAQKYVEKDSRVHLICQENAGPADARNQGLKTALGKYIMFCDSDDWYEPDMCEIMYNTIKNQKVDVVCCHNFFDCEEDLDEEEKTERLTTSYYNSSETGKHSLTQKQIHLTNVLMWNKIFRKDLIDQYQIRFPSGRDHEDVAFWYMYAFVADSIFYLNKPLIHYFLRAGSIMSNSTHKIPKNRMDGFAITEDVMNFVLKNNLENYFSAIPEIYRMQLGSTKYFFTPKELTGLCKIATDKMWEKLHLCRKLVYAQGEIFMFSDQTFSVWTCIRLAVKYVYFQGGLCLYKLLFNQKRVDKYKRKILKTKVHLKAQFLRV